MSLATVLRLKDYHPNCRNTGCGGKLNTLVSIETGKPPRVMFYCELCKHLVFADRSEPTRPPLSDSDEASVHEFIEALREGRSAL